MVPMSHFPTSHIVLVMEVSGCFDPEHSAREFILGLPDAKKVAPATKGLIFCIAICWQPITLCSREHLLYLRCSLLCFTAAFGSKFDPNKGKLIPIGAVAGVEALPSLGLRWVSSCHLICGYHRTII